MDNINIKKEKQKSSLDPCREQKKKTKQKTTL